MLKELKTKTSRIHFGEAFEKKLVNLLDKEDRRCVIITDSNVEKLYQNKLDILDCHLFSFPAGESSKTREMKVMLEDNLLSHNFGRDTLIIGIGGGVTSDLSGFLASTYMRGVGHIQIPTTLLSMVDAAIGGKTGVNTPYGKNMIGTFHPPEEIWIDETFLSTLPKKQMANGVVEIIKAGLIASPSLFESMREKASIMDRIYESVVIKADIVDMDPKEEKGMRRILNLGHTFGHAIEVLEDFQIEHGEAVAIGILTSCYISHKMDLLPQEEFAEIEKIFEQYEIPLKLTKTRPIDDYMSLFATDKKSVKAFPRFVLLESIGKVASFDEEYCSRVEFSLLEEAISWMHRRFVYE